MPLPDTLMGDSWPIHAAIALGNRIGPDPEIHRCFLTTGNEAACSPDMPRTARNMARDPRVPL
jgi:hypothetical protein